MATAQLVEDALVRQPQKPWTKAALLRVECAGSPPDGQENFLHELLGGRSLQTLQGQVKHQARVAVGGGTLGPFPARGPRLPQPSLPAFLPHPRRGRPAFALFFHSLCVALPRPLPPL